MIYDVSITTNYPDDMEEEQSVIDVTKKRLFELIAEHLNKPTATWWVVTITKVPYDKA